MEDSSICAESVTDITKLDMQFYIPNFLKQPRKDKPWITKAYKAFKLWKKLINCYLGCLSPSQNMSKVWSLAKTIRNVLISNFNWKLAKMSLSTIANDNNN